MSVDGEGLDDLLPDVVPLALSIHLGCGAGSAPVSSDTEEERVLPAAAVGKRCGGAVEAAVGDTELGSDGGCKGPCFLLGAVAEAVSIVSLLDAETGTDPVALSLALESWQGTLSTPGGSGAWLGSSEGDTLSSSEFPTEEETVGCCTWTSSGGVASVLSAALALNPRGVPRRAANNSLWLLRRHRDSLL